MMKRFGILFFAAIACPAWLEASTEPDASYYCGLVAPEARVVLRHVQVTPAMYRKAVAVNPYVAVALFSHRESPSPDAEPNPGTMDAGIVMIERSFSPREVLSVVESDGEAKVEGTELPAKSFIRISSEREAPLDDVATGEPRGFRISAHLENAGGSRVRVGQEAIVWVGRSKRVVAITGEQVEVYPVVDVVAASAKQMSE